MSYTYKQISYRLKDGRFDASLNKMAADGWRVISIQPAGDGVVLATFEKSTRTCQARVFSAPLQGGSGQDQRLLHGGVHGDGDVYDPSP